MCEVCYNFLGGEEGWFNIYVFYGVNGIFCLGEFELYYDVWVDCCVKFG